MREFVLGLLIAVSCSLSAETVAEKVFGAWEKVTPSEVLKPVAEVGRIRTAVGSVGKYPKSEVIGCPLYDQHEVIGWSMNCFPSADRGGIRGQL